MYYHNLTWDAINSLSTPCGLFIIMIPLIIFLAEVTVDSFQIILFRYITDYNNKKDVAL